MSAKTKKIIRRVLLTLLSATVLLFLALFIYISPRLWELAKEKYVCRGSVPMSEARAYWMDSIPVEPSQFRDDFESIFRRVKKQYAFIDRKGLDMDSLHEAYLARLDTTKTKAGYARLVQEFIGSLGATHCWNDYKTWMISPDIEVIEGRLFVVNPLKEGKALGLRARDEIVSIDGTPTKQWLTENKKYYAGTTDIYRYKLAAYYAFSNYLRPERTYGILRQGKLMGLKVKLPRPDTPAGESLVTSRMLNDSTGYISLNTFLNPKETAAFVKAFKPMSHLPNLVIDMRHNLGGDSKIGDSITTWLIKKPCMTYIGTTLHPKKDHYGGRVFILQGTLTVSSGETFLICWKKNGQATLVGDPSAGDMGGLMQTFKSKYGICFSIPVMDMPNLPIGYPLEGRPIKPDHIVPLKASDFLQGKDTQIEYILNLIRQSRQS